MPMFNTDSEMVGAKREAQAGTAETLQATDFNNIPTEASISDLDVQFSETAKRVNGNHTRNAVVPGAVSATITNNFEYEPGKFVFTGSAGSPTVTPVFPLLKYLESNGLIATPSNPSDASSNDGYVEFSPEKAGDCQTLTDAIYDVSTCNNGNASGIESKIAGAMSTLVIESESAGSPFMLNFDTTGKVEAVEKVEYANIPVIDKDGLVLTQVPVMNNTFITLKEVNNDGSDIALVTVSTFESDGTTPVDTFESDGTTPVIVYTTGNTIPVYDSNGDEIAVYNDLLEEVTPRDGEPYQVCSNTFSLDTGVTLSPIGCTSAKFGYKLFFVQTREPMLKISPLLQAYDDYEYFNALMESKIYTINVVCYTDSTLTDKAIEIEVPRAQLKATPNVDDAGVRRLDQEFALLENLQGATPEEQEHDFTLRCYGETVDNTTP